MIISNIISIASAITREASERRILRIGIKMKLAAIEMAAQQMPVKIKRSKFSGKQTVRTSMQAIVIKYKFIGRYYRFLYR